MRTRAGALILLALAGCSSILPQAPAETFYDLKYDPEPLGCGRSYPSPVEVWNFAATAPYDRTDMVVTEGGEVAFSPGHQWVDRPGVLVAQKLLRDLGDGKLFPLAVSPRDPEGAPLALNGTLYKFAWEKSGGSARAALEADVTLRRTAGAGQIVLHKRYQIASEPQTATADASVFARAMSEVVARFSQSVRRDLCTAL
jgi:ABC-type uncharacterized transport system auxiliary subunit